jgi:hypothetical protein
LHDDAIGVVVGENYSDIGVPVAGMQSEGIQLIGKWDVRSTRVKRKEYGMWDDGWEQARPGLGIGSRFGRRRLNGMQSNRDEGITWWKSGRVAEKDL